jgi:peptide-methionine (S)-S-oxide reductase
MDKAKLMDGMFGAGCFWGVQYEFDQIKGVTETEVGYAGGHTQNPTYKEVCTDTTGHAEVVHLKYDENLITYDQLLKAFWEMHDPTTMNRQGPDVGSQYRSIIFYYNEEQKAAAEKSKEELGKSGKYSSPIVTEIVPAAPFYKAEDYHQKYFKKTGRKVCH